MVFRLVAGLLGPLCAFVIGVPAAAQPAAASPVSPAASAATPWPHPKACLETELRRFEIWRDLEAHTQYLELLGASKPCAGNPGPVPGVRLALTQYRVAGSTFAGWMGDPWRTNSIGEMKFRRVGTLLGDDTTLCLDTGLIVRPDGVYGEHNRCFRVEWESPEETYGWDLRDVPSTTKASRCRWNGCPRVGPARRPDAGTAWSPARPSRCPYRIRCPGPAPSCRNVPGSRSTTPTWTSAGASS
jgi:hypothetical protein